MATFQGTTFSGYESISPYRSYLDLSMDDVEFTSNKRNPLFFSEISAEKCGNEYSRVDSFQVKPNTSSYGIIRNLSNVQNFKTFIDSYDLQHYMKDDFTLFIPIDNNDSTIIDTLRYSPLNALDIFNYHKLNYVIEPVELFDRKIRLQTKLRNQYILTNGMSIITETSKKNPNKILQSIKTDNGYIYLIEQPLIPYVY